MHSLSRKSGEWLNDVLDVSFSTYRNIMLFIQKTRLYTVLCLIAGCCLTSIHGYLLPCSLATHSTPFRSLMSLPPYKSNICCLKIDGFAPPPPGEETLLLLFEKHLAIYGRWDMCINSAGISNPILVPQMIKLMARSPLNVPFTGI